ncbi:hypothetical protein BABINDRAFT_158998 [Babjeviella inositovora NRRL Y-12698]|uniref:Uncharacterized protein n=1 Tax=Babjeviella inositovora NRRL Y-12698 TaxID=984486 RepID=A0A1E3QXW2_9ASCO|nr:uncharacterized protein BABINDRAFT_158998 [Babjeviella inositovora NRRL Y-12698]ODQ82394.1 hypothetical protein BABINDRAFT_158998 [Babjeviella inositovora NRRL Y-12698]
MCKSRSRLALSDQQPELQATDLIRTHHVHSLAGAFSTSCKSKLPFIKNIPSPPRSST